MKKYNKFFCLLMSFVLLFSLTCTVMAADSDSVNILFTHDFHSHMDQWTENGSVIGGAARLKTLIDKNTVGTTFLLDGGDFSMGTLYQAVFETQASELLMLGYLGFDATTIGNHEFDYRSEGFANMLNTAVEKAGEKEVDLPELLSANIDWDSSTDESSRILHEAYKNFGGKEYTIIERDGVKMGIFGIMGIDSQACAPLATVTFTDYVQAAKDTVAELQAENVDMIVCLSHSGTWDDPEKSEDEILAQAVPEIDVIISAHTHTRLDKPIVHGNTYIVSCGEYGKYLGQIVLEPDGDRWKMESYDLHATSSDVEQNNEIQSIVDAYKPFIAEDYLSLYGLTADQVLCTNNIDFASTQLPDSEAVNWGMGDLMADSIIHAVKEAEGENYEDIAMAIVPSGIVRGVLPIGDVTASDAFNILSLGIGEDGLTGYPLVSIYLTGAELISVAEVDASVSGLMGGTKLYVSGGGWSYNNSRLILNRATDVWTYGDDGSTEVIQKDKLYRVVADLYSSQMLGAVKSKSFGLLTLEPKDADGNPITDYAAHIIHDKNGNEVKQWVGFASFLQTFGGDDGTGAVDAKYEMPSSNIISSESRNPVELLRNPGKIFWLLCGVILLLLAIISAIVLTVRYIVKKKRKKI
ncbi:MAG: bifunctional metallophosphatase/5'-nucleotidase [Ruminococcaceae bacterium]|nr:bifunctional metallophosphatase/5'-nucleotidase [Oscillospiraceae bacterium]